MKDYESAFKRNLPNRLPVVLRCDGKAFHTYTKAIPKKKGEAYNKDLIEVMDLTAIKLCEEIQGAQMAEIADKALRRREEE